MQNKESWIVDIFYAKKKIQKEKTHPGILRLLMIHFDLYACFDAPNFLGNLLF